jgi:hypothetical protein
MTPEGKAHQENVKATYIRQTGFRTAADLGPYDRCISRGVVGSMMPVVYNNGNLIVQTPGYVVLVNEMIHESRIIPLDGRPTCPPPCDRGWAIRAAASRGTRSSSPRATSTARRARRATA